MTANSRPFNPLEECPFCGSKPALLPPLPQKDGASAYAIACPECAMIGPAADTAELATTYWNTRENQVAAIKAQTDERTIKAGAALERTAHAMLRNTMGSVRWFVLVVYDQETKTMGVLHHDETCTARDAAGMLQEALQRVAAGIQQERSGLILPAGVR